MPVRMMEAWLLFDEAATRKAAGNEWGREPLALPRLSRLESLPDPKSVLYELLRAASGLTGRRRKQFEVGGAIHRIADLIEDYAPLRSLPAFRELERDVRTFLVEHGWQNP